MMKLAQLLKKLTKLLGRTARAITGESYEVRSTDILQKLSLIPIEKILLREKLL